MMKCMCDPPFCLICFSIYVCECECVSDCDKIDE
jgi:hypothetical protein